MAVWTQSILYNEESLVKHNQCMSYETADLCPPKSEKVWFTNWTTEKLLYTLHQTNYNIREPRLVHTTNPDSKRSDS